ncbi:cyanophycinase [Massilia antarctica]|uniref:cyanophycinase n=1 Tax=Massilia antarctica TaxID=2765360 RepID=UPI0006BB840F|nr:cyanophycinase [Massilia sp. H27-R4]MCY0914290.1 cyanophycinase [Massilia sp. H27-R4]CUI08703.1 Cyanophycinase [Janthinobacterium sp. CG23_2]CUU32489.1 Cyanophycinase [Janthinobacterium sp. CG23_2]
MNAPAQAGTRRGSLLIIGGGEDREDDMRILERFIALCGGPDKRIVVLTAATLVPERVWSIYDAAFGAMNVDKRKPVHVASRLNADDAAMAADVAQADGIFMTGGDQKRLLALIGGTKLDEALHAALARGACIAGTSAGASAMSAHMLADGKADLHPEKGTISLGAGIGFVQRVVIDQHFSQRQRLARLLTVVAQNPYLLGVGIDEDTALLIEAGGGIAILGAGAVTVIDGRHMVSNVADIGNRKVPEMVDVRLHLLPSGSRYGGPGDAATPDALSDFLKIVTNIA